MFTPLKAATAALLICATTTLPALAETREERLAVATEYNDATLADLDMEAMIATMWKPLVDRFAPDATDDQKDQVHALYMTTFAPQMTEFLKGQPEIMADLFTMDELVAMRDFYATPDGSAVMKKLPELMQAIQPQIMTMVEDTMPAVIPEVMEILEVQQ